MVNPLWIDAINFVASIKVIEAGIIIESIDFTEENDLQLKHENKKRRGRPKMTQAQKDFSRVKREAGKTRRFSIGEEPNLRNKDFSLQQ